jgi:hypothetical protein
MAFLILNISSLSLCPLSNLSPSLSCLASPQGWTTEQRPALKDIYGTKKGKGSEQMAA